jgi:alpha-tubulin suppressor-like RCC1 family protein
MSGQKIVPNNCRNDFEYFIRQYCTHQNEKGDVYTWGSGETGHLGYSSKIIQVMPNDREGYPFQVTPHTINVILAKLS